MPETPPIAALIPACCVPSVNELARIGPSLETRRGGLCGGETPAGLLQEDQWLLQGCRKGSIPQAVLPGKQAGRKLLREAQGRAAIKSGPRLFPFKSPCGAVSGASGTHSATLGLSRINAQAEVAAYHEQSFKGSTVWGRG